MIDNLSIIAAIGKNNEIGKLLNISEHTVKAHLETIYEKLTVRNRIQAVVKAAQSRIINIDEILIGTSME